MKPNVINHLFKPLSTHIFINLCSNHVTELVYFLSPIIKPSTSKLILKAPEPLIFIPVLVGLSLLFYLFPKYQWVSSIISRYPLKTIE